MQQFLNADKCNPLQSEPTIQALEAPIEIEPTFYTFQEKQSVKNAWVLPADEVVKCQLKKTTDLEQQANEVHAILSADHGSSAFWVNLTTVEIKEGKTLRANTALIGYVKCSKDTHEVLINNSVVALVNESLMKLIPFCVPITTDSNGIPNTPPPPPVPIKLMGKGDLAFYLLILGKEHMAGDHCWQCFLRRSQFQRDPYRKDDKWTLALM